jgi:hypothetical protein
MKRPPTPQEVAARIQQGLFPFSLVEDSEVSDESEYQLTIEGRRYLDQLNTELEWNNLGTFLLKGTEENATDKRVLEGIDKTHLPDYMTEPALATTIRDSVRRLFEEGYITTR